MALAAQASFGAQLKALREAAGFTQEELATIAGLSVHAVSALERGERRRPHLETVRALSAALDLTGSIRDALLASARAPARTAAVDELSGASLPLPLTALLGRDGEVQTLRHWLADPATRLITLIGPGGVGKTRLALELARAIADDGSRRVVFVPLAAVRDSGFVAPAIAEALGLSDVSARDLPKRAHVACDDHPTLLVLDNFEHVLDAALLVADLLTSIPSLLVLTTSRAPLRLRGEREYAVGPLALEVDSEAMSPADVAQAPAVRLFVDRVRDVQPDFRLTSENGRTVIAICRRLDALPLALELAAPWIKALTAEGLLRLLERDVLLSPVGARDLPERQRTMNATVAWSYQLLNQDEQRAFRRFGVLPGRFPIEAAAAVLADGDGASAGSDDALRATAGLIDKSLLLRAESSVEGRPLYQMLETVRAYAALELAAVGERDVAREGLARYCTSEAGLAAEGLVGRAQVEWMHRVRDDLESYRAALVGLIEQGRSADACDIAWSLFFFWAIRGHAAEGQWWYEQILNHPSLPPAVESRALMGAGGMRYAQGDLTAARTLLTRARAVVDGTDDKEIAAHVDHMLGRVDYALGDTDAAGSSFTDSREGFRALARPWGNVLALNGMAWVALATGDFGGAERLLDEATSEAEYVGPWFLALTQNVRAMASVQRGKADEAITWVRDSLISIRELQDKFAFAYTLVPLAAAAVLKGNDGWAARILGARDAVAERTGTVIVHKSVLGLRELSERKARGRLGDAQWARAYAAGREASIDALLTDIDRASV